MTWAVRRLRDRPLTLVLIASWVVLFLIDASTPGYDPITARGRLPQLLAAGALDPNRVAAGEWWRFFTAAFLHFGLLHLALNSYAMYIAGGYVEPRLGPLRTALVYAIALVGGGLGAYLQTIGQPTLTVGASGAVMGLFGAMVAIAYPLASEEGALIRGTLPIVLTLLAGFTSPGISSGGHIGGLVSGGLAAVAVLARWPTRWIVEVRARQESLASAALAGAAPEPAGTILGPDEMTRETTTLVPTRRRIVLTAVVVAALAAFAGWTLAYPFVTVTGDRGVFDPFVVAGWIALVLAAIMLVGLRRSRLVLSPAGFVNESIFGAARVSWTDVARFGLRTMYSQYGAQTQLLYWLVPAKAYARKGFFRAFPDARSKGVPAVFGMLPEDQGRLMEGWKGRWAERNVRWPDASTLPSRSGGFRLLAVGAVLAFIPFAASFAVSRGLDERITLDARDLVMAPEAIAGVAQGTDGPIPGGRGWSRVISTPSGPMLRATIWVTVLGNAREARESVNGSTCERYYSFPGIQPKITTLAPTTVGDVAEACKFDFGAGLPQYSVRTTTRNVRVDVIATARSGLDDQAALAATRAIAATQLAHIDRLVPPR